jgi:hypothetical protein
MSKSLNISNAFISVVLTLALLPGNAQARDALEDADLPLDAQSAPIASAFVHSECDEMRSVALDYDPEYVTIDGEGGMFFPMPLARLVLCDVEEKAGYAAQLALLEGELELWQRQEDLRADQVESMQGALDFMREDAGIMQERLKRSESRSLHWSRHPGLWFGIGVVLTVAAMSLASRVLE